MSLGGFLPSIELGVQWSTCLFCPSSFGVVVDPSQAVVSTIKLPFLS
jgi:hypothetical protein